MGCGAAKLAPAVAPGGGPTPCIREGCLYCRTWHRTHCCGACERGGTHGPRCERRVSPDVEPAAKANLGAAMYADADPYAFLKTWAPKPAHAAGRKLNVLCLHGFSQHGGSFRGMARPLWSQCGDIADFHFPSAPHTADASHRHCKQHGIRVGPNSRTWTLSDNGGRGDYAKYLCGFVEREVPGPVDVLLGYSQGGTAVRGLLEGEDLPKQLRAVRAVVNLMSGGQAKAGAPTKLRSLHVIGLQDALVKNSASEKTASRYADPIIARFDCGHAVPFKPDSAAVQLAFLRGVHDFHSSLPSLADLEAEGQSSKRRRS